MPKNKIQYVADLLEKADSRSRFEFRLIYLGTSGGALRVSYREFANDMARPVFTEELTVPLGITFPQVIAVNDTKLVIHNIDAVGLDYELG